MFLLRPAQMNDLDGLAKLAEELDSLNLPADRRELETELENSCRSFTEPSSESRFMFVAEADGHVVGTSSIFAKHGKPGFPHIYFQVSEVENHSKLVGSRRLRFLSFHTDEDGPTELGGLVVSRAWRAHPLKVGLQLSMLRFLFIALHRDYFEPRLLSELMPTLREDRTTPLWDAIGAPFTGLSYAMADRLSIHNKEFILALFPREPICVELLPKEAQAVIGVTGEASKPAERMLLRIGFRFLNQVCPFDGGPHLGALTDSTTAVLESRPSVFAGEERADLASQALVVSGAGHDLRCVLTGMAVTRDLAEARLEPAAARLLGLEPGSPVWLLPVRTIPVRAGTASASALISPTSGLF
ncbi:MAG: arginine N-succinyltransferase [Planctomycetes bacterium]|nr:arginine N-succinyltransferase [Planctomycetota bacterium]